MKRLLEVGLLWRLLIPLMVLPLLGITPHSQEVFRKLGEARRAFASASPLSASTALAQAAAQLPWRADLWKQAGHNALQGGDPQAAIRYLERAASLQALPLQDKLALGDAYRAIGQPLTAIHVWQSIHSPTREVYLRLLETQRALDDYSAAIADLQALTGLQPANSQYRYQLGLLLATQQPEAALAHLTQAAELDPSLAANAQALVRSIRTALLEDDPAYTLLAAGRALASQEAWDLAAEAFHQATLVRPDYAEAWAFLGEARQHLGSSQADQNGLADLQKALALDPHSLTANILMALYWQRQERYDLALKTLKTTAGLYPENPLLQVQLGSTLAILGDLSAAEQAYQRATELAPQNAIYPRLLAAFSIKYEYQVRQTGLPAARQAVILAPNDPACLDVMGQVMLLLQDAASARRFLLQAIQADPNYAPAHLHLGTVYMLQGESDMARLQFDLAHSLAPEAPSADQAQRLLQNFYP